MNCPDCNSESKKHGTDRNGNQRFRCVPCNRTFSEPKENLLDGMYLPEDKAIICLQLLVEGMSVRSIERVTGVHRDTVLRLLETVGRKCLYLQDKLVRDVKVGYVEADEVWSFVQMKEKTKTSKNIVDEQIGSAYTYTCIDAETKLIVAWHLGTRAQKHAFTFLQKVRDAVDPDTEFQISTDAFPAYKDLIPALLGRQAHYGRIIKTYGVGSASDDARYSPAICTGCKKKRMLGNPDKKHISTSMVERNNLTMRMSMRRMTRLTNGFSKKWENLNYSLALHFAHYNFCRSHKTLNGATPAMAANLTNTIWTLRDLLVETKGVKAPDVL